MDAGQRRSEEVGRARLERGGQGSTRPAGGRGDREADVGIERDARANFECVTSRSVRAETCDAIANVAVSASRGRPCRARSLLSLLTSCLKNWRASR
jgi:hypothetical protein